MNCHINFKEFYKKTILLYCNLNTFSKTGKEL